MWPLFHEMWPFYDPFSDHVKTTVFPIFRVSETTTTLLFGPMVWQWCLKMFQNGKMSIFQEIHQKVAKSGQKMTPFYVHFYRRKHLWPKVEKMTTFGNPKNTENQQKRYFPCFPVINPGPNSRVDDFLAVLTKDRVKVGVFGQNNGYFFGPETSKTGISGLLAKTQKTTKNGKQRVFLPVKSRKPNNPRIIKCDTDFHPRSIDFSIFPSRTNFT